MVDKELGDTIGYLYHIRPFILSMMFCYEGNADAVIEVINSVMETDGRTFLELYSFIETASKLKTEREIDDLARIYRGGLRVLSGVSLAEAPVKWRMGRTTVAQLEPDETKSWKFPRDGVEDEYDEAVPDCPRPLAYECKMLDKFRTALAMPVHSYGMGRERDILGDGRDKACLIRTESSAYYSYTGAAYPWLTEELRARRHEIMC